MRKFEKLPQTVFISLLISLLVFSCKKKEVEPSPEIPPESTMTIDFSDFDKADKGKTTADTSNWLSAALPITFWNIALTVTYVVPVSAHKAAISKGATFVESGKWLWTFDHKVGFDTYNAQLTAVRVNGGVNWEMRLSKAGGFQNHLWYSGFSADNLESGYWKLYKSPVEGANEAILINWTRNADGSVAEVKHEVIAKNDPGEGNSITYGVNMETPYNAYYDVFAKNKNLLIEIDWSKADKSGRIKNEEYFNDSDWNCWNSDLENTICE